MEIVEFIAAVDEEGKRLGGAASAAGLDAGVAACPGWTVRDLTRHLGAVYRWAARVVSERLQSGADATMADELAIAPDGDGVLAWFAEAHQHLVGVLRAARPEDDFWRFSRNAPDSLTFWARRQAHETAMHRVDAEQSAGLPTVPFAVEFAADGIDELITVFLGRKRDAQEPVTVLVRATDLPRSWRFVSGPDGLHVAADASPAAEQPDVAVDGPADALYRLLWNRLSADDPRLSVTGDPARLAAWCTSLAVI